MCVSANLTVPHAEATHARRVKVRVAPSILAFAFHRDGVGFSPHALVAGARKGRQLSDRVSCVFQYAKKGVRTGEPAIERDEGSSQAYERLNHEKH